MELLENKRALRIWKAFELNILYSGLARTGTEWQAENVRSPFSRLYFILKGEGTVCWAGTSRAGTTAACPTSACQADVCLAKEKLRLKEGSLYLIPAGVTFSYSCEHYMEQLFFHVNVNGENGMDLFQGCGRILERESQAGQNGLALQLYCSESTADAFRLKGLIWEELAAFAEAEGLPPESGRSCSELVSRFFFLAQNPVSASNHVRGLAERLHVAESTLSKRFRLETGMAPGAYLNRLVLEKACRLLLSEEVSIAAVADRLGFSDQFYFTKYFRRQMSMTPSAYRRLMRRG